MTAEAELRRLLDIMAALRDPDSGCPWDRQQSFDTIAPYTIEEAYEVADAIARRDLASLPDELGDLLFQVVYHARMAEEAGLFGFAEVARTIADKMVRRHPHVFGRARGPMQRCRMRRRRAPTGKHRKTPNGLTRAETGTLAGIPVGLPALTRAAKLTARAARVGFDWPDADAVLTKLDEEVAELRAELPAGDPARLADEVGDLLFVLANLARKLDLDPGDLPAPGQPEVLQSLQQNGAAQPILQEKPWLRLTLEDMEAQWQKVKRNERHKG